MATRVERVLIDRAGEGLRRSESRLAAHNLLIERLPRPERRRFLAQCEPAQLALSDTLFEIGAPTRHVYFPTDGFVSLLTTVDTTSVLEVGMVGREGMLGIHVTLGLLRSPVRALVQGGGTAWRLPVGSFRKELVRSVALQSGLNRYLSTVMVQLTIAAACVRYHMIGPRLARWLLMTHDRTCSDRFSMTQECIACMLGVRRVGVTSAASELQRDGLIEYRRGKIHILDRSGLEAAACSCYARDGAAYAMLMRRPARIALRAA